MYSNGRKGDRLWRRFSAQKATREANILAYNDVFLIISILAFLLFLWGVAIELKMRGTGEVSPIVRFAKLPWRSLRRP